MRILCFGDSNTYGYDPRGYFGGRYEAQNRWVDLLAHQTGHAVINAGMNGRQIPRGPVSIPQADLLLVMLGSNDLLQGATAKEAAARMAAFLSSILPHCGQILLIAPPPMQRGAWVPTDELVAESHRLVEEYKFLAERLGIPFVDTRPWQIGLTFDGVHFAEEGHRSFSNHIAEFL